jgi:hypothetical protein
MRKQMAKCNGHQAYATQGEAEQEMARLIRRAKRTGDGGKSWKRLNIFPCGNHFHVGRANKLPTTYKPAPQQPKQITFAEARRKLARLDEQVARVEAYCLRKRIEIATRLVELDRQAGWFD